MGDSGGLSGDAVLIFYSAIKPDLGSLSPSDFRCAPSWASCRRPLRRIWHARLCSCCQGTSHVSQRETSVSFLSWQRCLLQAFKEYLLPSADLLVFSGRSTVNYTREMPSIFRPFHLVALTANCHLQSQLLSCAYWKNVIWCYSSSVWASQVQFCWRQEAEMYKYFKTAASAVLVCSRLHS